MSKLNHGPFQGHLTHYCDYDNNLKELLPGSGFGFLDIVKGEDDHSCLKRIQ